MQLVDSALWVSFFAILQVCVPRLLDLMWPVWWQVLPLKKKKEIPPCLVSLIHHFVVVIYGLYLIWMYHSNGSYITSTEVNLIAPFIYGYLVGDTAAYAIPEALEGRVEFLVHHALGLWLVPAAINSKHPELLIFCPHFLITELSSIFFSIGWILRSTSYKDSVLTTYMEVLFVISFILLRVFNFPIRVFLLWDLTVEIGYARYVLIPVIAMQFYWCSKIVVQIAAKIKPKKK